MEFYILDLKNTKFDMTQKLPSDMAIRSFLESCGIETGDVKVRANGQVSVFATANPCDRWPEFDGSIHIIPQLDLAVSMSKIQEYVTLYEEGKVTDKAIRDGLYHICNIALITMGLKAKE